MYPTRRLEVCLNVYSFKAVVCSVGRNGILVHKKKGRKGGKKKGREEDRERERKGGRKGHR